MATILNIAWAAGVYEGEGTFSGGHNVRVVQKDGWLIYELQRLFGGTVSQYNGYNLWTISGSRARGFLLTIFSFLSPRRKAQILEHPLFFKDPDFLPPDFCPNGHEYTPENTFMETGYKENGEPRQWRTCKICRKTKYDAKNAARKVDTPRAKARAFNKLPPEERIIRLIMISRKCTEEEAREIYKSTSIQ